MTKTMHQSAIFAMTVLFVILGLIGLGRSAHSAEPQPIVGVTGPSEPVWTARDLLYGMSWDRYQQEVKGLLGVRGFVPLREPLPNDGGTVLYGLNAVLPVGSSKEIRNLSWALVVVGENPPTLIVDTNANGILSDDRRIEFSAKADAKFEARTELRISEATDGTPMSFPVLWTAESSPSGLKVFNYPWRERRGRIQIGNDEYEFALRTSFPDFDVPGSLVGIDLNQDGTLDVTQGGIEVFGREDEFVPIAGSEYRKSVDPRGQRLALVATGHRAEPRSSLAVGTSAPTLPDGSPLSGSGGLPLLLNFWSPRCSFSKRMAPQLREAWNTLQKARFVSIAKVSPEEASSSLREFGHEWPQITGDEGAKLFSLYRVAAIPTYYVIDSQGVIRARGSTLDWPQIRKELDRLTTVRSESTPSAHSASGEHENRTGD